MNSRTLTLSEALNHKMLAWMLGVAGFSLFLSLAIALVNLRMSAESSVSLEMNAIIKAFRSEILGGEIRNAEIQTRNLLNLKEEDRIQVLDSSLHPLFENAFERYEWPVELKTKEVVWPSLFRLNILVPIYFDQDQQQLFGYLALDQAPHFHWTLFYLIFGSLVIAQAIFFLIYRNGVLGIGRHLSAQLALVETGLMDWTTTDDTEGKQKIAEVEAVRDAFRQIQSQINSLQDAGSQNKSLQQVAHDIRSPLSALSIGLKTLREVPPATRTLLETAFARVESIANDILTSECKEVSKLNQVSPAPQVSILQINDSISQLIEEKKLEYRNRKVRWLADFVFKNSDQTIAVEISGLFRSLSNILNNAIEASPDGAQISVRTILRDSRLNIEISDQGPGIPAQSLSLIMQGRHTTKANGHGLGVSGAKSFVEANGGTFDLDSSSQGLTVRLSFRILQTEIVGAL